MLGVVLCGGQSSRMGSDKGLLKEEDKTWAQTAFDKISELSLPVVLSVNTTQYADYAKIFSAAQLIKDSDSLKLKGPLCGVLSVHLQFPDQDLLILACDMPLMETEFLKELLVHYQQHADAGAFVYTNNGEREPLCAIYRAKGLSYIIKLYQSQQLFKHSMKFMLDHLWVYTLPIAEEKKKYFRNFNAHAELNGL